MCMSTYFTCFSLNEWQTFIFVFFASEINGCVTSGVGVMIARLLLSFILLCKSANSPDDGGGLVFVNLVVVSVAGGRQGLSEDNFCHSIGSFVTLDLIATDAT